MGRDWDDHDGDPIYGRMPPGDANGIPEESLRANSFFSHFDEQGLCGVGGSDFLLDGNIDVRDSAIYRRLLADAIPALSNPTGSSPFEEGIVGSNNDLMSFRRGRYVDGDWPREFNQWKHSDIKAIAYPFNFGAFDTIVTYGSLR